jgi:hypothetical protein
VLRGYLAAMVLAAILDDSGQPIGLLPRIGGSEFVALLLLATGVLGSIWLGRRSQRLKVGPRYALFAGSAVLVLVALGGFLSVDGSTRGSGYAEVNYDNPYGHVEDVFVYDQQGRLVEGARLFDQNGQPIRLGNPYCRGVGEYSDMVPVMDESQYPYCVANAPFTVPPARPAEPAPSRGVSPSTSARVSPSVGPSPSR